MSPARGEPVGVAEGGVAGDPLGDLVHVLQSDAGRGRRQMRVLKQPPACQPRPGIVGVFDADDAVRPGGGGVGGARGFDPEGVAAPAGLGGQKLRHEQGEPVEALAVQGEPVAVAIDLGPVVAEPGERLD
ncbi:hypothetical protein SDC9_134382 [bioreactor metagenome]|uniref:Uncharacterized protein n=1 Tax=bioreactor metagenome TaxID=1076179 RepID=A0A645DD41_9ZZZZ